MINNREIRRKTKTAHIAAVLTATLLFGFGFPLFSGGTRCIAEEPPAVTLQKIEIRSATVEEGTLRNFSGIRAISQIAGNMNQVVNNINVTTNAPH